VLISLENIIVCLVHDSESCLSSLVVMVVIIPVLCVLSCHCSYDDL